MGEVEEDFILFLIMFLVFGFWFLWKGVVDDGGPGGIVPHAREVYQLSR